VNIPEFAESITSVQVLAERVKQSSLGRESQAIKSWQRESSNQVLEKRVKQRSLGVHGFGAEQQEVLTMRVEQWRLDRRVEQQEVLTMRVEQWRLDGRVKHASESY
jgi:hypothetical protein